MRAACLTFLNYGRVLPSVDHSLRVNATVSAARRSTASQPAELPLVGWASRAVQGLPPGGIGGGDEVQASRSDSMRGRFRAASYAATFVPVDPRGVCHDPHSATFRSPYHLQMTRDFWMFLTNHGHVLVCLASDPDMLLRDVAARVGITERAVHQIVRDLELAGVIARERVGRRNRYVICGERGFRHALVAEVTVKAFLGLVVEDGALHDCPAGVGASAVSCPIATGVGCPLEGTGHTEVGRRFANVPRRLPAV